MTSVPILFGSFNVRETSLDLYLFYLEVTRRGGYQQVYCLVTSYHDIVLLYLLFFRNACVYVIYVAFNFNLQGLNLVKKLVSAN